MVGEVRDLRERVETISDSASVTVLTFRIEGHDRAGNPLAPVAAQLRGSSYDGVLGEGDEVRATGRWRDGTLRVSTIRSLTTGSVVTTPSPWFGIAVAIAFAAVVALAITAAVTLR